jgi:DNA-binding protein H-NS
MNPSYCREQADKCRPSPATALIPVLHVSQDGRRLPNAADELEHDEISPRPLIPDDVHSKKLDVSRADQIGAIVNRRELEIMSADELWTLHEKIATVLAAKINAEKALLEDRLSQLNRSRVEPVGSPSLRHYPRVLPKFRNPEEPSQTWAGRGKQPKWLVAKLKSGRKIDDFRIETRRKPK